MTPLELDDRPKEECGILGVYTPGREAARFLAVAEINHVSDFHVTVAYQRQGRKITALKFKVRRVQMLPHSQQPDLFPGSYCCRVRNRLMLNC